MARFGAAVRGMWGLEEGMAFLNHGSFGACPRPVLEAQRRYQDALEAQPVAFQLAAPALQREALVHIAPLVGASPEDLVFVTNATEGVNAIVRSLDLGPGDRILTTDWGYDAVSNTLRYVARRTGATLDAARIAFPVGPAGVDLGDLAARLPGAKVLVVDHIASKPGVVLPVAEIVALARAAGVPVLVDGAHAPGQIAVDLDGLGADWWVGNLHKWAFAPKGCAVLWARRDRQAALHPTVISHGLDQGFHEEFGWTGTRDPSAWLAGRDGVAFLEGLGREAVWDYQRALRRRAAARLSEAWGVAPAAPEHCLGAMVTLPAPGDHPGTEEAGIALRRALWERHRVEVPFFAFAGRLWIRVSAQVYVDDDDIERLAVGLGPDGVR